MSFSIADLAGEPQTNQSTPLQAASKATPAAGTFSAQDLGGVEAENASSTVNESRFAPYNAKAFGRYTTPENYEKWASTQPKTGPDSKPGEYEAWTGANTPGGYKETLKTIPVAAAETAAGIAGASGLAAIPEVLPSVLMHTADGVRALNAWAIRNPVSAIMLYHAVRELLPGAKKAMGIIKATPLPE